MVEELGDKAAKRLIAVWVRILSIVSEKPLGIFDKEPQHFNICKHDTTR